MATKEADPSGDVSLLSSSPSPLLSPTGASPFSLPPPSHNYNSTPSTSTTSSTRSASVGPSPTTTDSSRQSLPTYPSRSSSASYSTRQSMGGLERPKRRGYVRPQGTNFAASAQSRESVMNLGSIAHLQYYFARTGLLDGKGGQLAKKKDPNSGLDLSPLEGGLLSPGRRTSHHSDKDDSYASLRSSPDLTPRRRHSGLGSPGLTAEPDTYDYESEYDSDASHAEMLPPTVSTYNHRTKPVPRPPTLAELKSDLETSLRAASQALTEAASPPSPSASGGAPAKKIPHLRTPSSLSLSGSRRRSESDATALLNPAPAPTSDPSSTARTADTPDPNQGWHELQGLHILDVLTLAIRAARRYYTSHAHPTRLSSIRSERRIRADLLGVMDVLRRMATRNFAHGLRDEEARTMREWVGGVWDMLAKEEAIEKEEMEERRAWTWLDDRLWAGGGTVDVVREIAFLRAMAPAVVLPAYAPLVFGAEGEGVELGPFWAELRTGRALVELHNAVVARSKRGFGAIPVWHEDTGKPYRCAENLRFWIKAAELRWEVRLVVDVRGVVAGKEGGEGAWRGFEGAVWEWVGRVRGELAGEIRG
ncbi:hypothetical protein VE03_03972 [Pseudogymnoascus sp. 23342-1-I1]|nr:hypothetical protein VE03_03972 [Pseudogymnoascus sp. 23342-1-I1]